VTESRPAAFYCPEGSWQRTKVPSGYFSLPLTEVSLRNRVDIEKCPRSKTCVDGVQYANFFWFSGECSEMTTESGEPVSASKASVNVDEGKDGLPVGSPQRVLSPYPVQFSIDPASSYQSGGNFHLEVVGNGSTVQVCRFFNAKAVSTRELSLAPNSHMLHSHTL
jgi:hypothetical protein